FNATFSKLPWHDSCFSSYEEYPCAHFEASSSSRPSSEYPKFPGIVHQGYSQLCRYTRITFDIFVPWNQFQPTGPLVLLP
ncbi:hypothetical protein L9F63_005601, partial [Diploptera punctata]